MGKVIKKSFPKKGIRIELIEHYSKSGFPQRYWKVWVMFKDNRWLEIHGILITKQKALDFYAFVRRQFSPNGHI